MSTVETAKTLGRVRLAVGLCASLAACSVETAGLAGDAAGTADASADAASVDAHLAPDSRTPDSGTTVDSGDLDAGPRVPTAIVDVATTGAHGAHPAVVWDGTQFVVGLVVTDGSTDHVRILRLSPGEVRDAPLEPIDDGGPAGREDIALAADGAMLGVGWSEPAGGERALVARILPAESSASIRYRPIVHSSDRDDVHLFFADGSAFAAVRAPGSGMDERLLAGAIDTGALGSPELVTMGDLGETTMRTTSRGPTATLGSVPAVATRTAGSWDVVTVSGLVSPDEGDAAELSDGALLTVWLHRPVDGDPRVLAAVRLDLAPTGWEQRGSPLPVPMLGPDPALAAAGSHALLASNLEDAAGSRRIALAWLDGTGAIAAGPCPLPSTLPFSNDPDVACGAGWCAIVWLEGTSTGDTDFVTRVLQVPADPAAPCP